MSQRIYLTNSDKTVLVSDVDYASLLPNKWRLLRNGFVAKSVYDPTTKQTNQIVIHRVIMNAQKGDQVYHSDGDKLNNTRENLRLRNYSTDLPNESKVSQYRGVSYDKRRNKWRSEIQLDKKKYSIGTFENEIDAARARDGAAIYFHKESALLNFSSEDSIPYSPKPKKVKTSKYTGVCFSKRHNLWKAQIEVDNKPIHLGWHKTEESAYAARLAGEKKLLSV